ncbi:hypothetical protein M422DRAFT_70484 [Sphaerobolus stellatus SS14]|uniref:Carboxylic ester hydrolase n=1 Tax=Sphaerobolus stellatus (strain SS14) TaxID=990650 RepID=A0A0C9UUW5_SPHS4|nr:hypothetical protein M422DRAFT_70484 [Sphaerobolus stellatus SS14]
MLQGKTLLVLLIGCFKSVFSGTQPIVKTTSGILRGVLDDEVMSFKGIPFAHPPLGPLRFEPPVPILTPSTSRDATALGPSCLQQFGTIGIVNASFDILLFNTPPTPENEDCLFLNVWTPADTGGAKKAVMVWLFGGGFAFGSGSFVVYDGTSFAKNQDIIVVTPNYRTNVFGFPGAEELFPEKVNLGFYDQDLALQWVQDNIAAFGGDPKKVTIMGESAGAQSVLQVIQRHPVDTPFRAGIIESGAIPTLYPPTNFSAFDTLAQAVNCSQSPGEERLACLKNVPPEVIHAWANGPEGVEFIPTTDNITWFRNPIERISQHKTAKVPLLLGTNQDDGTLFAVGQTSLEGLIEGLSLMVTIEQVRALYPGLSDVQIIPLAIRDFLLICENRSISTALIGIGMTDIFRYIYGAVFQDLQILPNIGAYHFSEVKEIFGTFNRSTATAAEATLSHTMQTVWANFIKNPTSSPAPNWKKWVPNNNTKALAKLAFQGNVKLSNVVDASPAELYDVPCKLLQLI